MPHFAIYKLYNLKMCVTYKLLQPLRTTKANKSTHLPENLFSSDLEWQLSFIVISFKLCWNLSNLNSLLYSLLPANEQLRLA